MSTSVEAPRRRFESRLAELLAAVERTFGRSPRSAGSLLLLVAAAAGLAAARRLR